MEAQPAPEPSTGRSAKGQAPPRHRFAHQAMNARFEIVIAEGEAEYARQAAQAAFAELDRIEEDLSYFRPTSDVSRINQLEPGQTAIIGAGTMDCLRIAQRIWSQTAGAFDVTARPILECWTPRHAGKRPSPQRGEGRDERSESGVRGSPTAEDLAAARARTGMDLLVLSEDQCAVGVRKKGVRVDLGAIGKGYALDLMAAILTEWNLHSAVLHGAWSTAVALSAPPGEEGWPLAVGDPEGRTLEVLRLRDRAISRSGQDLGLHIFDPRTGRPAEGKLGAWSAAATGAEADALSTAFLVMGLGEVEAYCREHPEHGALLLVEKNGKRELLKLGLLAK